MGTDLKVVLSTKLHDGPLRWVIHTIIFT